MTLKARGRFSSSTTTLTPKARHGWRLQKKTERSVCKRARSSAWAGFASALGATLLRKRAAVSAANFGNTRPHGKRDSLVEICKAVKNVVDISKVNLKSLTRIHHESAMDRGHHLCPFRNFHRHQ